MYCNVFKIPIIIHKYVYFKFNSEIFNSDHWDIMDIIIFINIKQYLFTYFN